MNHASTDPSLDVVPAGALSPAPPSLPAAPSALGSDAKPDRPFQLATPTSLRPAVTLGLGLPARVSGLPAFYYWKDAIVVGSYVHPTGRFSLEVTRDKLDGYVNTFARMRANGVGVPILMDHAPSAAATLGWIIDVKRRGDRLLELHQFLGESARDVGLRNFVSLGIDPNFVDGRGVRYGEAIVHSAVTPTPVVPGQDGFEEACGVGEAQPKVETITLSLASDAASVEPATSRSVEASTPPEATASTSGPSPSPGIPGEGGGESDYERRTALDEANHPHPDPLPEYRERGPEGATRASDGTDDAAPSMQLALAALADAAPSMQLALGALADAAAAKRDLAVARGGIAPAVADELFAMLVRSADGALNIMALSRSPFSSLAGGQACVAAPLALAVFDALSRNQPVPLGEATQLQVLSRRIPGEDDERIELRDRMIALASARR